MSAMQRREGTHSLKWEDPFFEVEKHVHGSTRHYYKTSIRRISIQTTCKTDFHSEAPDDFFPTIRFAPKLTNFEIRDVPPLRMLFKPVFTSPVRLRAFRISRTVS